MTPHINLNVRLADQDDAKKVWEIRNSPEARRMSLSSTEIPLEQHLTWFAKKYQSPGKDICYVAEINHEVMGYCRFDLSENGYIVSIALDPAWHGKGLSKLFLAASINCLPQGKVLNATVEKNNPSSLKLFHGVNFSQISEDKSCVYFQRYS